MKRILVVGGGLIGSRHVDAVLAHPACELVGLADPDMTLRTDVTRFAAMAEVDVHVDGVIIATPTQLHADHAIEAAQRGWHMLIEKPVTETLEQAGALVAAVKTANVRTLVGHHRRYHTHVEKLRQMITNGDLGTPITATMIWAMRKPDAYFQDNWRSTHGSPVMINLVHDVDLLRYLFGDIDEIHALGSRHIRNAGRPESGAIAIRFKTGLTAAISFADTAPSPWGFEAGTGENPNIATTGQDMMWITCASGSVSFPSMTVWSGSEDWSQTPKSRQLPHSKTDPLAAQMDHFIDVLNQKAAPKIPVDDAAQSLAATLRIQELLT
ncbi:Gfo/Idh/MocA family protein [Sulfitobacter sp.]|uniref:Gfo/Idh/MocA family protein n=1 Tax=Sulfitobacter sp. TaxID=1903071 RepID=UPI003001C5B4